MRTYGDQKPKIKDNTKNRYTKKKKHGVHKGKWWGGGGQQNGQTICVVSGETDIPKKNQKGEQKQRGSRKRGKHFQEKKGTKRRAPQTQMWNPPN